MAATKKKKKKQDTNVASGLEKSETQKRKVVGEQGKTKPLCIEGQKVETAEPGMKK